MVQNEQLQAYLLWLQARGQRYVRPRHLAVAGDLAVPVAEVAPAAPSPSPQLRPAVPARRPRVLFLGDAPAPGTSQPFTTEERDLLDKVIAAMHLAPGESEVATLMLERPDGPITEAMLSASRRDLGTKLASHGAELVVVLGGWTLQALQGQSARLVDLHGQVLEDPNYGVPLLATYHPRDLLRFAANKRIAWGDLQVVMAKLGLTERV